MARKFNRLSARTVATVVKRGRYPDGDGLYLQVSSFKTKAWIFRYTLYGKHHQMGLGSVRNNREGRQSDSCAWHPPWRRPQDR